MVNLINVACNSINADINVSLLLNQFINLQTDFERRAQIVFRRNLYFILLLISKFCIQFHSVVFNFFCFFRLNLDWQAIRSGSDLLYVCKQQ